MLNAITIWLAAQLCYQKLWPINNKDSGGDCQSQTHLSQDIWSPPYRNTQPIEGDDGLSHGAHHSEGYFQL